MRRMKKRWKILGFGVLALLGIITAGAIVGHEPLPEYTTGPEADSLATEMLKAVSYDKWISTNALTFTFAGRHHYLWDKSRQLARIEWGAHSVLLRLSDQTGVAFLNGSLLTGKELESALQKAWSFWCNDSFWFCAPVKCFDPGTIRGIVIEEGAPPQLLIRYTSGGVTPGDSYLWILDEHKRPTGWKMWTSIIPVGGVYSSWENWKVLESGATVATTHSTSSFELELTNVQGATSLSKLGYKDDPFDPLLTKR